MRVLQCSSEIFPLLKTGGLADVTGALPAALRGVGCDTRVLLPGVPAVRAGLRDARAVGTLALPWGESAGLLHGLLPDVPQGGEPTRAYVIDAPALYDRPGNPYEDAQRRPHADNHRRFAALSWAAARLADGLDPSWRPQLVHGHDWHAGLAPAYLRLTARGDAPPVPCVFTIHNLAYQGLFDAAVFDQLGLPPAAFRVEGLEFYGRVSFIKAGIHYADRVTTVSPTYAREIQTPEQGQGLDGLLRARRDHLVGILNGVDTAVWNPARDPRLPSAFDAGRLQGKARCKAALRQELGLEPDAGAPLFVVVSRLSEHKGLSLVLAAVDDIVAGGGQLFVLGTGERELEQAFARAAQTHSGRVAVHLQHDEDLAHRAFAGGDVVLVPSRFEPCGLTQSYGLMYGCLPLVRRVGGLADTVVDTDLATLDDGSATGFVFDAFDAAALRHALRRAFALWRRPRDWARVRRAGMQQLFGWESSARRLRALYDELIDPAAR